MAVHFHYSTPFNEARERIEQHLYDSILKIEQDYDRAIEAVDRFAKAIDRLADTLEQMYQNPGPNDTVGEKSFPIRDGQFRVFYKVGVRPNNDFDISFIDIDHNKQSNSDRYPTQSMITFDDED
ncbi:MAG: hypothetical protein A2622_00060 [Bdellovibrionales bacterium RIFCSPHIGHO2_01_FULL_40_29]|nr:MAG: hypothetical protein A2622_00060 [Bdellovibrionales bacterium RIFCSPHIGHO2_01_FULL_40_29]OFZ32521.1 MAG: hypothetical protein A3D17_04660 [Bdellovibrionales bacterium RIFCSPHIGHO2_02_FULL_40_15]